MRVERYNNTGVNRNLWKLQFLFISIYFFISFISFAQQDVNINGYNKFYYENGKISSEGNMKDGRPDGYWKTYSMNGKIKSEGNRKDHELDSLWKFYDGDGKILTVINYKNGKKDGVKNVWAAGKHVVSEEHFSEDLKQGMSTEYFLPDDSSQIKGQPKFKTPFDKGKENGLAYEYDKQGNIITMMEYSYGVMKRQEQINREDKQGLKQGAWKDFYPDGKVKSEINFIGGKKSGYVKTFSPTGSLLNIEKYVGDSLEKDAPEITTNLEVRNEYYEDGSIKKTGTYLFNLAEGTHKEYSPEGKITGAKIYKEGSLIAEGLMDAAGNQQGPWKEYHPGGKLKAKGNYDNGVKIGDWIFYFPNGKIEQRGKYSKKGKPEGLWQWFYDNEKSLREENYLNGRREGAMTEWNDSGKVITKGEYIDGLKEGRWFYQLQDYREEGVYKSDLKDGPWESYFVGTNKLRFAGKFIEGLPDGKHTYYFYDGKIEEEGKYIMGNKDGNWQYFSPEDGTILITITFKNNREIKFDGMKVKPFLPGENPK